jgi:predicted HTH domain antitoxin
MTTFHSRQQIAVPPGRPYPWSMLEIKLSLPEEALLALKRTEGEVADELRLAAAMKLYELGRLSSGSAASVAGVPRTVFLSKLADYGVATFRMSEDELAEDLARA